MRFRTGLVVGLAVGYYYGARAGRERYEQIEQWLERLRTLADAGHARVKLSDGVREGTGVAWRLVQRRGAPSAAPDGSHGGAGGADTAPVPTEETAPGPELASGRPWLRRRRRAVAADVPGYGDPTLN